MSGPIYRVQFSRRLMLDAVAMNTKMKIVRSKSLALHIAEKLGLDKDAEFQPEAAFRCGWTGGPAGVDQRFTNAG
jgi:hypothetical protein